VSAHNRGAAACCRLLDAKPVGKFDRLPGPPGVEEQDTAALAELEDALHGLGADGATARG
jgi:hypothetical protein